MKTTCGLDVHKDSAYVCILQDNDQNLKQNLELKTTSFSHFVPIRPIRVICVPKNPPLTSLQNSLNIHYL